MKISKIKLHDFFEPLIFRYKIAKEIKANTERYLANDFNLLELINPDENKISDLIALLLNPKGTHGQGNTFLKEFIKLLIKDNKDLKNFLYNDNVPIEEVIINREFVTHTSRRIDILIEFYENNKLKFIIGIENKPWAEEQDRQLIDYNKYLKNIPSNNYLLIYLDGFGRKAKSIDKKTKYELIKQGKFMELSYEKFLKVWLNNCYKECEAEKVRFFLKDFFQWLNKNFKDEEE